jgi:hypothetical protein
MLESDAMASKRVKPKPKTAAAKRLAAVKRKAKGLDTDEESEEDYMPTKAAMKAKKLTPVKRKIKEIEPIDDVSGDEVKKTKPSAPKAAIKKPQSKPVIEIDSPKPVRSNGTTKLTNGKAAAIPKPVKKPVPTITKKKITLDSDSEDDFNIEDSVAADDS